MPKLTITALNSDVSIQDPFPSEGQLSIRILAGTTSVLEYVHFAQLQRISSTLVALEALEKIEYSIEASDQDSRAQEADLQGLPNIDFIDSPTIAVAGQTGIKMSGPAIEGFLQLFATLDLGDGSDPNAVVGVRSLLPGYEGNKYEVEVVDDGSSGFSVAVAADKITVELGGTTQTATAVAAAINAEATAKTMVFCTAGGTGASNVALQALANLAGGVGEGILLTCGGFACTITAITVGPVTEIVFDVPALTGILANYIVSLQLRANAKMYVMSVLTV
jgi:hypothetical protein